MDRQTNGCGRQMDGWIEGYTNVWTDGHMDGAGGGMDGQMGVQMDVGITKVQMGEGMNGQMLQSTFFF